MASRMKVQNRGKVEILMPGLYELRKNLRFMVLQQMQRIFVVSKVLQNNNNVRKDLIYNKMEYKTRNYKKRQNYQKKGRSVTTEQLLQLFDEAFQASKPEN